MTWQATYHTCTSRARKGPGKLRNEMVVKQILLECSPILKKSTAPQIDHFDKWPWLRRTYWQSRENISADLTVQPLSDLQISGLPLTSQDDELTSVCKEILWSIFLQTRAVSNTLTYNIYKRSAALNFFRAKGHLKQTLIQAICSVIQLLIKSRCFPLNGDQSAGIDFSIYWSMTSKYWFCSQF